MKSKRSILFTVRLWLLSLLMQVIFQPIAWALTSGPSQPEFESFTPISSNDMVDLFTGDFSYNIPLLDVGGYPINLSYNSGVEMDQEASWVGLGWNLSPGSISRQVRGLPDDFNGDQIERKTTIADDYTVGIGFQPNLEFVGISTNVLSFNHSIYYNNYRGFGIKTVISPNFALGELFSIGVNLSGDSQGGGTISPRLGIGPLTKENNSRANIAIGMNTRNGLSGLTLSGSLKMKERQLTYSGNYSLSPWTYRPSSSLQFKNSAVRFRGSYGSEAGAVHPAGFVDGYYSVQSLADKTLSSPAFGYMYHQNSNQESDVLDYNRSNPQLYSSELPDLPSSFGTYDYFLASAQGVNTQFHLRRNDVGVYRPAKSQNIANNTNLGFEFGLGGAWRTGAEIDRVGSITQMGYWGTSNLTRLGLGFQEDGARETPEGTTKKYQNAFFVSRNELSATNEARFEKQGGTAAIATPVLEAGNQVTAIDAWSNPDGLILQPSEAAIEYEREKRSLSISYLTNEERARAGLDKGLESHDRNALPCISNCTSNPMQITISDNQQYPAHHISEITITQPDGSRYVYGLPVYNRFEKNITFSVEVGSAEKDDIYDVSSDKFAQVSYESTEAGIDNESGREKYYEEQETPQYAHSFLLTAVLSADYEDRTGDGISDDDLGNATRFNYSKTSDNYSWRTPSGVNNSASGENYAKYIEGHRASEVDDKATFSFGEREQWYLHSIESRTHVAQFYTSKRADALGVDENGHLPSQILGNVPDEQRSFRLDSIKLFSKSDLAFDNKSLIPIKGVHFNYDYELCQETPNSLATAPAGATGHNGSGKLTLRKIFFTYGYSRAGELNAYKFAYKSSVDNAFVGYKLGLVDRWGCYQDNAALGTVYPINKPVNMDYPYVIQDRALQNNYAGVWSLNQIETPSGAQIAVQYEADDYAYVQNRRAGRMFFIRGFVSQQDITAGHIPGVNGFVGNKLYDGDELKDFVYVDISDLFNNNDWSVSNFPTDQDALRRLFFDDVEQIYFKALVQLTKDGEDNYTTGYFEMDDNSPIFFDSTNQLLRFRVRPIAGSTDLNPITLAALQQLRLELPELIYPGFDFENRTVTQIVGALIGVIDSFLDLVRNFEGKAKRRGWGQLLRLSKTSWLRLADPSYAKIGGGCRVAQITVNDQWNEGIGASVYGQKYTYELEEDLDGNYQGDSDCDVIDPNALPRKSSGVASWEPLIGGEENLWKEPNGYREKIHLAPDNYYYQEKPYLEGLYPSPVVGYSRVVVESINNLETDNSGTGYMVSEYYTAKDFPTIVERTPLQKLPLSSNTNVFSILSQIKNDRLGLSQGFSIETNNMHGQMKRSSSYDDNCQLLSASDYLYKTDDPSADLLRLNNTVNTVLADGKVVKQQLGVDVDLWQEMLEEDNLTTGVRVSGNLDVPILGVIPVPIPSLIGVTTFQQQQVRASMTTKHVHRQGILEKVVVTKNGASLDTENLAFDELTGEVLVSRMENEYGESIFSTNYPAYWSYEGMGGAYDNVGTVVREVELINGLLTHPSLDLSMIFKSGDELVIRKSAQGVFEDERYFVWKEPGNDDVYVLDITGTPTSITGAGIPVQLDVKIIRSGKRNVLAAKMQGIQSLVNPIQDDGTGNLSLVDWTQREVLAAQAATFSDRWNMNCPLSDDNPNNDLFFDTEQQNLFTSGLVGHWRVDKQWSYYDTRRNTDLQALSMSNSPFTVANQYENGLVEDFLPFWSFVTDDWQADEGSDSRWIATEDITYYDRTGGAIESVDALGIFSAVQNGYNSTLPIAVAANSNLQGIGADNFEDYFFDNTSGAVTNPENRHFSILRDIDPANYGSFLTSKGIAHTGRYALSLTSEFTLSIPVDGAYCEPPPSAAGDGSEGGISAASVDCFSGSATGTSGFVNDCCACTPPFSPIAGSSYYVSVWVATDESLDCSAEGRHPARIVVDYNSSQGQGSTQNLLPDIYNIDGWYRISGIIDIPEDATSVDITFANLDFPEPPLAGPVTYYDDFRILPEEGAMQTYTYDPRSLRLWAELDDNNYATFYEYDDAGLLTRIKRETERGIMTIQEGRTVLAPNNQ